MVALTALLMGCFRQSKRRVALFLEYVLNQPCSPGWVVKLQQQATAAITPAYDEVAQCLPAEPVLGIDESPTKEGKVKAWLWTFVAPTYTLFALRTTRAATILDDLLTGAFDGVINCDRAKMYWETGKKGKLQWCWAHLKRDFQALIDHPDGQVKHLGRDLMRCTKELFRHWSRCRDGTITYVEMQRLMQHIRLEVEIRLVYYPPYHSKYNRIERCWSALERKWSGSLLTCWEVVLWLTCRSPYDLPDKPG